MFGCLETTKQHVRWLPLAYYDYDLRALSGAKMRHFRELQEKTPVNYPQIGACFNFHRSRSVNKFLTLSLAVGQSANYVR